MKPHRASVFALFFLLGSLIVHADNFAQFGNAPVPMNLSSSGRARPVVLQSKDGENLNLQTVGNDPQSFSVSTSTEGLRLTFRAEGASLQGLKLVRDGKYQEAVNSLRPAIYPMIRFLDIPVEKTDLHDYVQQYLSTLYQTENFEDEAYSLMLRFRFSELPPAFSALALSLVSRLAETGRMEDVMTLINLLPSSDALAAVAPILRSVADQLREQQEFTKALSLYERSLQFVSEEEKPLLQLWVAYCNFEMGNRATVGVFLESMDTAAFGDDARSLKLLIEGKLALANDNTQQAMWAISRGVVLADVGSDWAPELSYLAGVTYQKLGNTKAAKNIFQQLLTFSPNSSWAAEARKRLFEIEDQQS